MKNFILNIDFKNGFRRIIIMFAVIIVIIGTFMNADDLNKCFYKKTFIEHNGKNFLLHEYFNNLEYRNLALSIKTKYHEYSDLNDIDLAKKYIEKYPKYKNSEFDYTIYNSYDYTCHPYKRYCYYYENPEFKITSNSKYSISNDNKNISDEIQVKMPSLIYVILLQTKEILKALFCGIIILLIYFILESILIWIGKGFIKRS